MKDIVFINNSIINQKIIYLLLLLFLSLLRLLFLQLFLCPFKKLNLILLKFLYSLFFINSNFDSNSQFIIHSFISQSLLSYFDFDFIIIKNYYCYFQILINFTNQMVKVLNLVDFTLKQALGLETTNLNHLVIMDLNLDEVVFLLLLYHLKISKQSHLFIYFMLFAKMFEHYLKNSKFLDYYNYIQLLNPILQYVSCILNLIIYEYYLHHY